MRLWIGNMDPDTTDEELKAFIVKYGGPEFSAIQRVPGDGTRPAAMLTFDGVASDKLYELAMRLHGMHWNKRSLVVQVMR